MKNKQTAINEIVDTSNFTDEQKDEYITKLKQLIHNTQQLNQLADKLKVDAIKKGLVNVNK